MHLKTTCRVRVVCTVALIALFSVISGCSMFPYLEAKKYEMAIMLNEPGHAPDTNNEELDAKIEGKHPVLFGFMIQGLLATGWPVPDHWWDTYQQMLQDSSSMGDDPYDMYDY